MHRSQTHRGKRYAKWSNTDAAREAAARTANLKLGMPAARISAKAGPFESNINAKNWIVIDPDGGEYTVRNLRLWCETHADRFEPYSWRNAYAGLRQVAAWLSGSRDRQVSQWRGWTLKDAPAVVSANETRWRP